MRCLLTGASGFVGANLAHRLLREGHEVNLLLRPKPLSWRLESIEKDARLHHIDVLDDRLAEVVQSIRPEWVFHLAAYGAYSWQNDLSEMVRTNLNGTINLVQACLKSGFEAFVNAGSSSEYGFKDHPPAETEFLEPNSHYAVTKAAASLFCRHTAQRLNLPLTTLRLYSAYGAYEEPNRLMPTIILRGMSNDFPPLVAPETARDYVHIDDVVEAFLLTAQRRGSSSGALYNLGTGIQTTLRQVVEVAREALSIRAEPRWATMPARLWDASCWVADNRLIQKELGWSPRYSFSEGFREMVSWFCDNPKLVELYRSSTSKS